MIHWKIPIHWNDETESKLTAGVRQISIDDNTSPVRGRSVYVYFSQGAIMHDFVETCMHSKCIVTYNAHSIKILQKANYFVVLIRSA